MSSDYIFSLIYKFSFRNIRNGTECYFNTTEVFHYYK